MTREPVHQITSARRSPAEDLAMRRRRYVWMMGIRIVVFVAAVALPLPIPVVIALMVVAVLLPWIAVQTANVGPLPERGHRPHREGWAPRQLPGSGPRAEL